LSDQFIVSVAASFKRGIGRHVNLHVRSIRLFGRVLGGAAMAICNEAVSAMPAAPSERTFYMRPLPFALHALDSEAGRRLFAEALLDGTMASYFRLAQQFHTQSDPAYCGLGSLVSTLNALGIDPARPWKGPWRWFSEELLDCCKPLEEIRRLGLSLDEVACLASCSGTDVALHRPGPDYGLDAFRAYVIESSTREGAPLLIVNYSRQALGQTGDGHFSPIGGYHAGSDSVLVLDTARFKYPPHWVPLELLFAGMQARDGATGQPRGWLGLRARLLDRRPVLSDSALQQHSCGI
jgi:glutathione gamma-glutamylcysteinyltransferase